MDPDMRASAGVAVKAKGPQPSAAIDPLLAVRGVGISFGGIVALDNVSMQIEQGEILGLIGPNGAGKTTLFNCLTRIYTPNRGTIEFAGQNILTLGANRISGLGIARTFQNLALFRSMSVLDNVRVGGHSQSRGDFFSDALHLPWVRREESALGQSAREMIHYLGLDTVAHRRVSDLPFGTQKRVELARALAARPKLLLLDEPAAGLNHNEVGDLGKLIRSIRDEKNVTVLLVEHHMNLVMSISDRVVALDFGRKIAEGTPDQVRNDSEVIRAYLGT
jgi:branched-chain amino acid transport system ATP-binding protein